ncbi:MAG: ribonuclease R [Deltaproteobacteria bacterium]|nr:ribonuclease R [Deltaproteobacteria bacterium]
MSKKSKRKISSPSFSLTEILHLFKTRQDQAVTLTEIAQALNVPSDQRKELRQNLRDLMAERKIIKLDRRHYSLPPQMKAIAGRVQAHRNGYGFLIPENSRLPDIFLSKREVRDLMHRDRVALHLDKKERGRKSGPRVIEVLARANRRVVGRYEEGTKFDLVIPEDQRLFQKIRIPKKAAGGAVENKVVLAEITRYPTKQEGPEGRILKVLGDPDDPALDSEIIMHKYDLPDGFPSTVLKEASAIPQKLFAAEITTRKDLRNLNFFTIDGENARDFDDAVAISPQAGQRYTLWVSIADVSHYVKQGSSLDKEAFRRGTSVYFPQRALPMIPPQLSNGICSLNPEEDRLCLSVAMEFDGQGRLIDARFFPSVIKSHARLTYTMVKEMLQQNNREFVARHPLIYEDLRAMADLGQALRARRMERGSIDFDLPEPEVILDVWGQIEEIVRAERHIGHQIIEEFMIATNEAVASFLARVDVPFLRRVHEPPEEKKVEDFKEFVSHLGYRFSSKGKLQPKIFQRLLEQARGKPEEKSVNYLLLRSMKQARYSEKSLGHFALASTHYLHFTSPIRRYPDLVVHRILKEVLQSEAMKEKRRQQWQNMLPKIAEHSSLRERVAMEAEREIVERKKVQFMRDKVGQEFNGYISGILPFGFFVELEDYFIEGLVHLTRLPEDRYRFLETKHTLIGERRGRVFRLGDRVRVRVDAADLVRRQVDFSLIQ